MLTLMDRRSYILAPMAVTLLFGCADGGDGRAIAEPSIRLAIVGQALIEHDPRDYFETPMSTVLPLLGQADAVFTNLEVAVSGPGCACVPTRDDVYFHGAQPNVLDFLAEIGVSLLALSNNHSWDYGTQGILSTIDEAEKRGLIHAGTGMNVAAATAPAYLDLDGFRLGLVSLATVNSPDGARATPARAGANMLDPGDTAAWDRNIAAVQAAAAEADAVLAYQHFQIDAEPGWQERWARATIDAGADVYVSHGEPTLAGVEVYGGGLILYGLGNFIFHTRTELGRYPPDVWQSVIAEVTLDAGRVRDVTFIPIALDPGTEGPRFLETRGYPEVAGGEVGQSIVGRLADLSRAYGTTIELREGRATLEVGGQR
jgi:poly-gamma-glutamate synthesis protein (capsule biosynthesis protein)